MNECCMPTLFDLMKNHKLTQDKLAEAIGVSQGNISEWKSGRSKPTFDALIKLADYFGVSIDYLVGRTDNPVVNR